MKYLYPQLNARLKRLAMIGAVLILTLMFLTACGGGGGSGDPPHCTDETGAIVDCGLPGELICIFPFIPCS